ncbi:transporter substrate-binding domain-containing protein [Brucella gallinifaecis]|uniref:Transporter substrate-binding domain-containing protein n=1 Tax=Brucella gallinifaecis TaxID=215590 RepID=A0A502BL10_9HYPH|nr:transporter substrate-binding domain-containing protein [Brucella gallinifaecis]TPF74341.1 transporter substrate-binding domain-containing protein [Brucella gallinifaecis]
MLRKTTLTLLFCAAAGAFSFSASADTLANIKNRSSIKVGIDLGQAPFGMVNGEMKQVGSDVDTARLLAKDLGVELEVVSIAPANRIQFLMTGKVDVVIASFSITEERKKQVDFSYPYAVSQVVVATTKGQKLPTLESLAGKDIAVTRGSTNDTLITEALKEKNIEGARVVRYDDNASTTNAVISGQQDVYAVAASLLIPVNEANPNNQIESQFPLKVFPLAVGLRKNEPALKNWVNDWVMNNLKNGELNKIYQTYHGASLPDDLVAGKFDN